MFPVFKFKIQDATPKNFSFPSFLPFPLSSPRASPLPVTPTEVGVYLGPRFREDDEEEGARMTKKKERG